MLFALAALVVLGVIATTLLVVDGLTDERAAADVALVLGNTVNPDGQPSARLRARLDAAVAVYRAGRAPVLLVSGGLGKEGHDEAVVMRNYLVSQGIPAAAIVVDSEGWTTGHSARNAAAWMRGRGLSRAIVVTQYFHVPRSKLALRKCGVASVSGAHARYFELRDFYSTAREVVGWLAYRFRGGCGSPEGARSIGAASPTRDPLPHPVTRRRNGAAG